MPVLGRMGGVIVVEFHVKAVEVGAVFGVYLPDECFGVYSGFAGAYHNGRAVRVIGAKV